MKKTIWKVFSIIMILVAAFLAFNILFKDGGMLRKGYNAVANRVNKSWCRMTEGTEDCSNPLIAEWKVKKGADNLEKIEGVVEQ